MGVYRPRSRERRHAGGMTDVATVGAVVISALARTLTIALRLRRAISIASAQSFAACWCTLHWRSHS